MVSVFNVGSNIDELLKILQLLLLAVDIII